MAKERGREASRSRRSGRMGSGKNIEQKKGKGCGKILDKVEGIYG